MHSFPPLLLAAVALLTTTAATLTAAESSPPNIVYILCDDLGYGDVHALNTEHGRIPTPNIDHLIAAGMTFSDAHSSSSVCTPSRYGILTGRYAWRTRLQAGVLEGESAPLIVPDRLTVAAMLRSAGYDTACIGKWHLGMDLPKLAQQQRDAHAPTHTGAGWNIDYAGVIRNGPIDVGFNHYFGILASLDMPPFVYVRDNRFVAPATVEKTWVRAGAAASDFDAETTLQIITSEAVAYIARQAPSALKGAPFFAYIPLTSPHTPILPEPAWRGKSGIGNYGDFVMQTDDCVGQILAALDKQKLTGSTLVIFTSDNGCSPAANPAAMERLGHFPSADRRGYKSDIWDGGHRIPFIASWPRVIVPGSQSDQLTCLTDLMATCAEIVHVRLPDQTAEDSVSMLAAMTGHATHPLREAVVHHSIFGCFAIRQGRWKLEFCPGSGGWSSPKDGQARAAGLPSLQLYNMTDDVGERQNIETANPAVITRLTALMTKYIADGRSTPGALQHNDVTVEMWKMKYGIKE